MVIARSFSTEALVILLDDPTRGIDVGAKSEIHQILNELTSRGCGVVIVSSGLPQVLAMSDRLIVLYRGQVRAELGHEVVDHKLVSGSQLAPTASQACAEAPSPAPHENARGQARS